MVDGIFTESMEVTYLPYSHASHTDSYTANTLKMTSKPLLPALASMERSVRGAPQWASWAGKYDESWFPCSQFTVFRLLIQASNHLFSSRLNLTLPWGSKAERPLWMFLGSLKRIWKWSPKATHGLSTGVKERESALSISIKVMYLGAETEEKAQTVTRLIENKKATCGRVRRSQWEGRSTGFPRPWLLLIFVEKMQKCSPPSWALG